MPIRFSRAPSRDQPYAGATVRRRQFWRAGTQANTGVTMAQTLERRPSPARREHRPKLFLVGAPGRVDTTAPDDVRVLIADGDNLARAGLRALLEAQPDIVVAGCAADGAEAVLLAREIRPDVLVVDLALPGIDGVEVTRQIVTDADTAG